MPQSDPTKDTPPQLPEGGLSDEEADIIAWIEQAAGGKLTPEEVRLCLEQARALGEL